MPVDGGGFWVVRESSLEARASSLVEREEMRAESAERLGFRRREAARARMVFQSSIGTEQVFADLDFGSVTLWIALWRSWRVGRFAAGGCGGGSGSRGIGLKWF